MYHQNRNYRMKPGSLSGFQSIITIFVCPLLCVNILAAAQNRNIIRKWCLSILKVAELSKRKLSMKKKRFATCLRPTILLEIVLNAKKMKHREYSTSVRIHAIVVKIISFPLQKDPACVKIEGKFHCPKICLHFLFNKMAQKSGAVSLLKPVGKRLRTVSS